MKRQWNDRDCQLTLPSGLQWPSLQLMSWAKMESSSLLVCFLPFSSFQCWYNKGSKMESSNKDNNLSILHYSLPHTRECQEPLPGNQGYRCRCLWCQRQRRPRCSSVKGRPRHFAHPLYPPRHRDQGSHPHKDECGYNLLCEPPNAWTRRGGQEGRYHSHERDWFWPCTCFFLLPPSMIEVISISIT